jgi:hypothetical protein
MDFSHAAGREILILAKEKEHQEEVMKLLHEYLHSTSRSWTKSWEAFHLRELAGDRISAASPRPFPLISAMGSGIICGLCSPRRKEVYPDERRDIRWEPPDWPDDPPEYFRILSRLSLNRMRRKKSSRRGNKNLEGKLFP